MWTDDPKPVFTPLSQDGYTTVNYALLHARGLNHLTDTMRYERAFLARKTDLDRLVELANGDGLSHVTTRLTVLLGKYDWRGPTKAGWTHQRLLSDMELQEARGVQEVYDWAGTDLPFQLKPKLKFQSDLTLTGPLPWLLTAMFLNKAMPCNETDSHTIEAAFWKPGEVVTATLTTFVPHEKANWHIPPK